MTVSNTIKVSTFLVANGPAIDAVAAGGGNPFVNVLRPGVAVSSVQALVGGPTDNGGVTPGGVTPAAAGWGIALGNVATSYEAGLRVRSSSLISSGGPSVSAGGLTAEIDDAGNYALTSDAGFGGPVIVTFISRGPGGEDGASVLASGSISVGDNYADNDAVKTVDGSAGVAQEAYTAVDVGGAEVTVSIDCTPAADGVSVALAALDAPGGAIYGDLAYVNPSGDSKAGVTMTLALTYKPASGTLMPLVQVAGGSATFANLAVYRAPSIPDLAVGANELDLTTLAGAPIDGSFDAVTNVADLSPGVPNAADGASSDVSLADGAVALGEDGAGFDNLTVAAAASSPANIGARVWAKGEAGRVDVVITALKNFAPATSIGQFRTAAFPNFAPVSVSGQVLDADTVWVTVQGVGGGNGGILVDDLKVTQVQDLPEYFDADLYGL